MEVNVCEETTSPPRDIMSGHRPADSINSSQPLSGFNMEVGPSHVLLQPDGLLLEGVMPRPAWADFSCQSLTRTNGASPLAPPLSWPLNAGESGCPDNVFASDGPSSERVECVCCGTSSAPLWRRDSVGRQMCNSCSSQENREDAPLLKPRRRAVATQRKSSRCVNCETETSPLWRRNSAGQQLCNACGLYYKLHQVDRPLSLKKDWIQTRNRKVTNQKGRKKINHSQSRALRLTTPTQSCFSCYF